MRCFRRTGRRNRHPVHLPPPEFDRVRQQAVAVDPHRAVQGGHSRKPRPSAMVQVRESSRFGFCYALGELIGETPTRYIYRNRAGIAYASKGSFDPPRPVHGVRGLSRARRGGLNAASLRRQERHERGPRGSARIFAPTGSAESRRGILRASAGSQRKG